jgi:nucleotide-binding universal stress UspA family protein
VENRLIVGFDGSEASTLAVRWAAGEAERRGASVKVLSAYDFPVIADPYGITVAYMTPDEIGHQMERVEDGCLARLHAVVASTKKDHPHVRFDWEAVNEDAATLLLAEAEHGDLLVLASSGAGAVKSFVFGSVVAAALHGSPCPVVVVPAVPHHGTGAIVVGVDGSEQSVRALTWATGEAALHGGDLGVIHAWEYPYASTSEGRHLAEADATTLLAGAVHLARQRVAGHVDSTLFEGGAVSALLNASRTAAMVIVGSRGRGGLRAMVSGSVAIAIASHAASPVVVVR